MAQLRTNAAEGTISIGDALNLAILEEMLRDPTTTIKAEDLQAGTLLTTHLLHSATPPSNRRQGRPPRGLPTSHSHLTRLIHISWWIADLSFTPHPSHSHLLADC